MRWPIASPLLQPNTISACLFQLVIVPEASIVTTASSAVSMINRVLSSVFRNSCWDCLRSSMSVDVPTNLMIVPSASHSATARLRCQR